MLDLGCGPKQRSEISRFEFPCSLEVERSKSSTEERGRGASKSLEPDRVRDSSGGAGIRQCERGDAMKRLRAPTLTPKAAKAARKTTTAAGSGAGTETIPLDESTVIKKPAWFSDPPSIAPSR